MWRWWSLHATHPKHESLNGNRTCCTAFLSAWLAWSISTSGLICRSVSVRSWAVSGTDLQIVDDWHFLQSCVWARTQTSASALTQTCLKTHKQTERHTHPETQTNRGKTNLRISDAGREAALNSVTLEFSGHNDQKQGSSCPSWPDAVVWAKPEQAFLHLRYPKWSLGLQKPEKIT